MAIEWEEKGARAEDLNLLILLEQRGGTRVEANNKNQDDDVTIDYFHHCFTVSQFLLHWRHSSERGTLHRPVDWRGRRSCLF